MENVGYRWMKAGLWKFQRAINMLRSKIELKLPAKDDDEKTISQSTSNNISRWVKFYGNRIEDRYQVYVWQIEFRLRKLCERLDRTWR